MAGRSDEDWVAVEPEFVGTMVKVKPAVTAFHFFMKENQGRIKADLEGRGEPHGLGDVQKAVASQWRALDDAARARYEELGAQDKARYEQECAARDQLAEEESARKRQERADVVLESRMRDRPVDEEREKKPAVVRPKRELTEEEIKRKRATQEERAMRQAAIDQEHEALADERARQAEARLSYLLKQSDIFQHFGLGTERKPAAEPRKQGAAGPGDASGGRRAKHRATEDDDAEELTEEKAAHFLLAQPSLIKFGQLRPYQLEGLNWMIRLQDNGINGILADEMGLGKTLQSISVLAYNREYLNVTGPHLILVPKSTLSNWCNEFRRWCPVFRVLRFHGTKEERQALIAERLNPGTTRDWDVVITTYEVSNLEKTALSKFAWQYLIIDEAHRLKNEASQFSQTVRLLQTAHRLLITGTPLQNNLHELWALLNFLLPDVFASAEQFDDWFNLQIDDAEQKQRLITQLHKILRPFMLRRLKADVESSLPPKTETLVFCEMSPLQRETYKKVLERDLSVVAGTENSGRTAVLNIVMQLRKACNHPYLFQGVEDRSLDPLGDHVVQNCGKMSLLDKLLKKLKEKGHRVLIFCQMTRMLDILEDFMYMKGHAYCRIDGNTTYEERENLIDTYNAPGSEKFVFLLSTRAGGLGINLQTADTVILYDSDWNPQADLQAQDRAHRIGQRKPVNIYRLVTQGTIEEKIIERAQKKLKLDAMVVQSGRLQDKDKMSKDELLEAIRFGADVIFRPNNHEVTDEDIDLILERGRKRTQEMEEKLKAADKGDLLDFSLDGGMSAQVFEGQDYSRNRQGQDLKTLATTLTFLDMGKRERKQTQTSHTKKAADGEPRKKHSKLPKHLRLPRIDDSWMFFNRERLHEIQQLEEETYKQRLKEDNTDCTDLLPPELEAEKKRLLSEGFDSWTKNHFNGFVKASAKYGRLQYEKIAAEIQKTPDEVQAYSEAFWMKGEKEFSASEWDKIVKNVEKGEKKLEDIARLTKATQDLVGRFRNPWEELTFQFIGQQGKERVFSTDEDRYLLCLTNYYGYGNWDKVKRAIRRCDRFRFDYFLRSCSAENLGKRCEQLMRAAEKENAEYERKRQAVEENRRREREDRLQEDTKREKEDSDKKRKIGELEVKIAEEDAKMAEITEMRKSVETRVQLGKAKASGAGGAARVDKEKGATVKASRDAGDQPKTAAKGASAKTVPDDLIPLLVDVIHRRGSEGLAKITQEFQQACASAGSPGVSQRQVELKVKDLAARGEEGRGWHVKAEYQHLIGTSKAGELISGNGAAVGAGGRAGAAPTPAAKKQKTASRPAAAQDGKRKREADADGDEVTSMAGAPKKARNAVTLYLMDHKQQVRQQLGSQATNDDVKNEIKTMWKNLPQEDKAPYQQRAEEEKSRFDREMAEWESSQRQGGESDGR
jgi:SWI/SNF-related matrix-associated actin-dependent regulator of chromatin subfamily A member 5